MDATSTGPDTARRVGQFVADSYTLDTLDLIDGSLQCQSISGGARVSFIVPLGRS